MRKIKFRGKARYGGDWVYGALLKDNVFTYVLSGNPKVTIGLQVTKEVEEVLPETVGQFTGLHDKNGVEIFEGDLYTAFGSLLYEIRFVNGSFCGGLLGGDDSIFAPLGWASPDDDEDLYIDDEIFKIMEVIGNIHEGEQPCTSAIVE